MLPTYQDGELLLIYKSKSINKDWEPQRGQVVVVKEESGDTLLKRVVALEGEHVEIRDGGIYINDKKYEDEWTYQDVTFWAESERERSKKSKKIGFS
uniref:Peptidase S26 domain-containing protein n=1 Tax=uncultured organism MedDCM-OCT-S09-C426 TaxID=743650 RepID=D6PL23_9ZZZZ|nr:hypothetical protein [uncultured organism MedDCM-OCT-S09-C426]